MHSASLAMGLRLASSAPIGQLAGLWLIEQNIMLFGLAIIDKDRVE